MKRTIIALIALVTIVQAFAQELKHVKIDGVVPVGYSGQVYLQEFHNKMFTTIDSVRIADGKFIIEKDLVLPELYGLTLQADAAPYYIFLCEGTVKVNLNPESDYSATTTEGSPLQNQFTEYFTLRNLNISEYIAKHPASIATAYILYRYYPYRLTADEIRNNVKLLDASLSNTTYVKTLLEVANTLESVNIGCDAPDFSAASPEGKEIAMKQVLKGTKYLLVDFWASWCKPCRKENPNVLKAYQMYHDKGFDVLGVSLDKSHDAWTKAIADDGLVWQQVSDLKYWDCDAAKLYGIRLIPGNVLINSDGKIIARYLKGQDLLDFLGELLK